MQNTRYRLRTFGTFGLLGPDDETILGTHGHQHRRIALLSVLAAAGRSGRSRDNLLLLFWPDATQARARHSLEQLVYSIRNSVDENVFAGTNPVRINPDVLASDVEAFNDAVERKDFEAAVNEYRGPFLDGFYLSDSPEFEQWLGEERARLARAYTDALERLALNADGKNDHAAAVRWWQKLVEADPVSGKNATGLIRALKNAGDHTAALVHAERYEAIVGRELGTSVGPAIANLVAEIRAASESGAITHVKRSRVEPPPAPVPQVLHREAPVEQRVDQSPERTPPRLTSRSRLIAAAAVIALLMVGIAWLAGRNGTRTASAGERSIAVLPLNNVGRRAEDAAFVDGLSEELMAALNRIDDLRVIARTSAFAFQNTRLGAREIADSLGVSNVLEGSVQRSGTRLRVQVRLIDALDGSTRWSQTFDRELIDVFGVQSDIASAVASELDLRLGAGAARKLRQGTTRNIAAYDLYLRGRDPIHQRFDSDSGRLAALGHLRQAVTLDPNFAAAYAHMPYWYATLARNVDLDSLRALRKLADSAAQIAVRLEPSLPEAHTGVAVAAMMDFRRLRTAEAELRRALELGAAPRAREHLANVLIWMGRPAEALTQSLRAAEADPLSASAAADLGRALCFNGRHSEGLARLAKVSAVRPPLRRTVGLIALCHATRGAWEEAIAALRTASDRRENALLGYYYARAGDSVEAKRIQANLVQRWQRIGRGSMDLAVVAAGLGDYDEAFEWIGRSGDDHSFETGQIMFPLFDRLRRDARFGDAARRIGIHMR